MRISGAIEQLKALKEKHGDLRMGNCGHFGEFYEMDGKFALYCHDINTEGTSLKRIPKENIIEVATENIGPDPD